MKTSWHGTSFRITIPLWGEYTSHGLILHDRAANAEVWYFCIKLTLAVEQAVQFPVALTPMGYHCNDITGTERLWNMVPDPKCSSLLSQYIKYLLFWSLQVKSLRRGLNGFNFADNIFKCIFLNENVWISIRCYWILFPRGPLTAFHHWFR